MDKLVTNAEMTEIDRRAQEEYGIPGMILMENAGQNAFRRLREELQAGQHLVFLCGAGNNGGDGMVMARAALMSGMYRVSVLAAREGARGNAELNLEILRKLGAEIHPFEQEILDRADWVIDALSGTGISGALRPPLSDYVEEVNASPARVCAIDVPSGISDSFDGHAPSVRADLTLTMGAPKRCLYHPEARGRAGDILVIPLDFPPALLRAETIRAERLSLPDLTLLIPPVSRSSYKNRRGVVTVFGASPGKTGAALLAAEAAGRSSAGMVHLQIDSALYHLVAPASRSVMVHPREAAEPELAGAHSIVAGPGWGTGPEREESLRALVSSGLPGVLDADGINQLAATRRDRPDATPRLEGRWVLTPHPGEFRRLLQAYELPDEDLWDSLPALAEAVQAVVCYKSNVTIIAEPGGGIRLVDGMLPETATGGAGDILAGTIGAFLARGLSPVDAAAVGALVHHEAGLRSRDEAGWFLAEDMLPVLSRVVADFTETVY